MGVDLDAMTKRLNKIFENITQEDIDEIYSNRDPESQDINVPQLVQLSEEERDRIVNAFENSILENQQDLEPEFSRIVDKYFWELI